MAKYREITEDVLRRMRSGEWSVGQPFDSIAELQQRYDAALNTVRAGLAPLREAGYIRIEQGRRPVVTALPAAAAKTSGVLAQLLTAREALTDAIEELRRQQGP